MIARVLRGYLTAAAVAFPDPPGETHEDGRHGAPRRGCGPSPALGAGRRSGRGDGAGGAGGRPSGATAAGGERPLSTL